MTKTFGFDVDGELVPVEPGAVASNAFTFPDFHVSAPPTLDYLAEMRKSMDKMMGVPSTLLMNPDMFSRTATALERMREDTQPKLDRIHKMMMNQFRIVADKYCPLTVRRQFRFPRSKKKRIRKKLAKDQRNWRDESVAFFIKTPKGTPHDDQIDAATFHNFSYKRGFKCQTLAKRQSME